MITSLTDRASHKIRRIECITIMIKYIFLHTAHTQHRTKMVVICLRYQTENDDAANLPDVSKVSVDSRDVFYS